MKKSPGRSASIAYLNYMGSLIRAEGKTFILVNTDIKNAGRTNFTKAHELGHFSLNHKGQQFECSRTDMLDSTRKPLEEEANQFAKESSGTNGQAHIYRLIS